MAPHFLLDRGVVLRAVDAADLVDVHLHRLVELALRDQARLPERA
jgi:hypothetical protein